MKARQFADGARLGIPIALGYITVSFSFGMLAVQSGLSVWEAMLISMTNLTSAGQFAGLNVITAGGSMAELAATQLVINLRYMLMSLALSQRIEKMPLIKRLIVAFGITDEVFTVAATRSERVSFPFMLGLIGVPYIGWSLGTFLGAYINNLLPESIASGMGIMLYAMFIAIIIPEARKSRAVLITVIIAAAISCFLYYLCPFISSGWAVIISAAAAALIGAFVFPVKEAD